MKITSAALRPMIESTTQYDAWIRGKTGKADVGGSQYVLWLWDNLPTGAVKIIICGKKYSNLKGNPMAERFRGAFI